jgi:hypothetical protein
MSASLQLDFGIAQLRPHTYDHGMSRQRRSNASAASTHGGVTLLDIAPGLALAAETPGVEAVEKLALRLEFGIGMDTKGTETAYRSARWPDSNLTT